jgi:hypothetical protein
MERQMDRDVVFMQIGWLFDTLCRLTVFFQVIGVMVVAS